MPERPWRSIAVMEGVTNDGRWLQSIDWRDMPLALTSHHDDPLVVGRVDSMAKHNGLVFATGVFLDTDDGAEAAALLEAGALRWMSAEWIGDWEMLCVRYEDMGYGPECVEALQVFPEATIVKLSQVGAGAFEGCVMELVPDGEAPTDSAAMQRMLADAEKVRVPEPTLPAVVAHAYAVPTEVVVPVEPPLEWS